MTWESDARAVPAGGHAARGGISHSASPVAIFPRDLDFTLTTGPMADPAVMDKLVSLCKRRGFIFQSSEIYGGLGSVWDYGPLGVELKRNVKERW